MHQPETPGSSFLQSEAGVGLNPWLARWSSVQLTRDSTPADRRGMNAAGANTAVTGSPTAPAGKSSGKERRRKRTRWGPDAEDNSREEPRQPETAPKATLGDGSLAASSAAGEAPQFPGPPPLPGQAIPGAANGQQTAAIGLDSDEKPRKRKRSRWQPEEEQTPIQLPHLAMVPGLPGMALPPSLIGLVDINPETMELHRRLNLVSSSKMVQIPHGKRDICHASVSLHAAPIYPLKLAR